MVNPADEKTIINVKGFSAKSWVRAKIAANKQGQTMGEWLARASDKLADLEDGQREYLPGEPVNLAPISGNPTHPAAPAMSGESLSDLMHGIAALAEATGVAPSKANLRQAYALADERIRQERGVPPRRARIIGKASGQSLIVDGKAR